MSHALLWCLIGGCGVAACGVAPPTNAGRPGRIDTSDDGWRRSVTWMHATASSASGAKPECAHTERVIAKERAACEGRLCQHGKELAEEWLDQCTEHAPDSVDSVRDDADVLRSKVEEAPTRCVGEFRELIDDCGKTCVASAQRWATRCAENEGSPLTVDILQRVASRTVGETVRLDTRSCATFKEQLHEGARCADQADCRKALERAEPYQTRCVDEGRMPPDVALQLMALEAGAGRPITKRNVMATQLSSDALPVMLAGGNGGLLSVCNRRVATFGDYIDARDRCGGPMVFAVHAASSVSVAKVSPLGTDDRMLDVLAMLVVKGEPEHAAKELGAALDQAIGDPASVVALLDRHAREIEGYTAARAELDKRDTALRDTFTALARAKLDAANKRAFDKSARRGVLIRARTRPFADIALDGTFSLRAATAASMLTFEGAAMKAHATTLAPLAATVRRETKDAHRRRRLLRRSDEDDEELGRWQNKAKRADRACHQALAKASRYTAWLKACAFGPCEPAVDAAVYRRGLRDALSAATRFDEAAAQLGRPPFAIDESPINMTCQPLALLQ